MRWLEKLRTYFRKHNFDLDQPVVVNYHSIKLRKYTCTKCGKVLHLDYWQMLDLPFSMARNCPGKKVPYNREAREEDPN